MTKCDYCGKEVELPFKCNFCGHYFCLEHRLPENHNCPNEPPRTPLGSYQTKLKLMWAARTQKMEKMKTLTIKKETKTYGNIYGYHFTVPTEVYADDEYREKLDKAKNLNEVERIIRDYYKKHRKKKS